VPPIYLDEDMTERLLDAIKPFGVDAMSANRGAKGLHDGEQLLRAVALGRVMVTTNTNDYLLLHRAWLAWSATWDLRSLPRHRGILLIHSAPGYGVPEVARVILDFLTRPSTAAGIDNRAFAWTSRDGWHERH
jgi:hypothetical protein